MALRTPLSVTPHLYMGDSTGRPLDMGTVYFGEPDKDPEFYPIELYSDDALTKPLMQPVHTKGGYLYDKGDMVEPHAKEIIYSVKVLDSYGRKVFYKGAMMRNSWNDDVIEQINEAITNTQANAFAVAAQVAADQVSKAIEGVTIDANLITDALVATVARDGIGGIKRSQKSKNDESVSPYDFGAKGDGVTDDSAAFQEAAKHGRVRIPKGNFLIESLVTLEGVVSFVGAGGVIKPKKRSVVFFCNVGCSFHGDRLDIDGSLYGNDWNADNGMYVFGGTSSGEATESFSLTNSTLKNIYGAGVRVNANHIAIENNILTNVAGNNFTQDPSGAYDNYGDGIHVMHCKSGYVRGNIVNNKQALINDSHIGRCGIVSEFNSNNVTIENNYVAGYDRGIHIESAKYNIVTNNFVELCCCAVLLSSAPTTKVVSNVLLSNKLYTVGTFRAFATLYSWGANAGSIYEDNIIAVDYTKGYGRTLYAAVLFSGATPLIRDVVFRGNVVEGIFSTNGGFNVRVTENIFKQNDGVGFIRFLDSLCIENNTFEKSYKVVVSQIAKLASISNNVFLDVASNVVEITNVRDSGFKVNDNRIYLSNTATVNHVFNLYAEGSKLGEISGNLIISETPEVSVKSFSNYASSANLNAIYSLRPNMTLNSRGDFNVLKIKTNYGLSENTLDYSITGGNANPPTDNHFYTQGSRVHNVNSSNPTNPTMFIALNNGYAASTEWLASTARTVGNIRYAGNKVYRCTIAGTTGTEQPTATTGEILDGSVTWEYLGAKSIFKAVGAIASNVTPATGADDTTTQLNALIASLQSAGLMQ